MCENSAYQKQQLFTTKQKKQHLPKIAALELVFKTNSACHCGLFHKKGLFPKCLIHRSQHLKSAVCFWLTPKYSLQSISRIYSSEFSSSKESKGEEKQKGQGLKEKKRCLGECFHNYNSSF